MGTPLGPRWGPGIGGSPQAAGREGSRETRAPSRGSAAAPEGTGGRPINRSGRSRRTPRRRGAGDGRTGRRALRAGDGAPSRNRGTGAWGGPGQTNFGVAVGA